MQLLCLTLLAVACGIYQTTAYYPPHPRPPPGHYHSSYPSRHWSSYHHSYPNMPPFQDGSINSLFRQLVQSQNYVYHKLSMIKRQELHLYPRLYERLCEILDNQAKITHKFPKIQRLSNQQRPMSSYIRRRIQGYINQIHELLRRTESLMRQIQDIERRDIRYVHGMMRRIMSGQRNIHRYIKSRISGNIWLPTTTYRPPVSRAACSNVVGVRLEGGNSTAGRVVLTCDRNGRRIDGTVCDDICNQQLARVICGMLNMTEGDSYCKFGYQHNYGNSSMFNATMPILLDNVACTMSHRHLNQCGRVSTHNCGHGEDIGVVCNVPIPPLANGSSTEPPVTDSSTEPPVTDSSTEPPVTDSSTEPPVTDSSTEPPVTDSSTEPPVTDSSTEPPVTGSSSESSDSSEDSSK